MHLPHPGFVEATVPESSLQTHHYVLVIDIIDADDGNFVFVGHHGIETLTGLLGLGAYCLEKTSRWMAIYARRF